MLKLCAKILIEGNKKWEFTKVTSVEIDRDSENLTTTCKIVLPRKTQWRGETSNPLKRGDKVTVWLGYDDDLQLAFKGYIISVGLKAPIEVFCEDEMFILKNTPMDYSLLSLSDKPLRNVLQSFLGSDFPMSISDKFCVNSFYRSSAENVAHWLFHLASYGHFDKFVFRPLKNKWALLSCTDFTPNLRDIVDHYTFRDDLNIVDSNNLVARSPVQVYVYIHSLKTSEDSAFVVERGARDRAAKRFIYRKALLKRQHAEDLADYIVNRENSSLISGYFDAFGAYMVWPMDIVHLVLNGADLGLYIVSRVITSFGKVGYRNRIYLGPKPQ